MDGGDPAGGSADLAELVDKHGEVLVPDLQHYFGIDLRELFSEVPPFSPRWVLIHVKWLPIESATFASIRGGNEFRGWSQDRYMLTSVVNLLKLLIWVFTLAHSDPKKRKPKMPEMHQTPDEAKSKKKDKPGSFGFIAKQHLEAIKKREAERA